jgi:hypothetical protein
MTIFIFPNTFLRVRKHHDFRKKNMVLLDMLLGRAGLGLPVEHAPKHDMQQTRELYHA